MSHTLSKAGSTLTVSIPEDVLAQLHWDENTEVICTAVNGKLVIATADIPVYDLDELVAGITPENLHEKISTGPAVGNEAW